MRRAVFGLEDETKIVDKDEDKPKTLHADAGVSRQGLPVGRKAASFCSCFSAARPVGIGLDVAAMPRRRKTSMGLLPLAHCARKARCAKGRLRAIPKMAINANAVQSQAGRIAGAGWLLH